MHVTALSLHVLEARGKTSESCCEKVLCKLGRALLMSAVLSVRSFSSPTVAAVVATAAIIVPIGVTSVRKALSFTPNTAR